MNRCIPPEQFHRLLAEQLSPGERRALESQGRAEVYGIYFDFSLATLKQESRPVLQEIADLMRRHPDWQLNVEGHTDSIGGAAANLAPGGCWQRASDRRMQPGLSCGVLQSHLGLALTQLSDRGPRATPGLLGGTGHQL